MAKHCLGCNTDKKESDFNRNRSEGDGLQRWCRECMNKYLNKWNGSKTGNEIKMRYDKSSKGQVARKRFRNSPNGQLLSRRGSAKERLKHPKRIAARMAVKYSLRRGDLIMLPCEVCGEAKTHSHHDDYSKQLDVRWLCPPHHYELHAEKRRREGEQKDLNRSWLEEIGLWAYSSFAL